jgi:16S rRNA (guanine527-N7)-methyltransferase
VTHPALSFIQELAAEFAPYGALSAEQLQRLEAHYQLLIRWNQKINLTRIESQEDAVRLHYCESLYLAKSLPPEAMRIADVGSGAGFPGIPVAVFRPDCTVHLIESNQRKAVFLRQACSNLENVTVVADRAEVCRGVYDWVVARAVRPDQVLACGLASDASLLMSVEDAVTLKCVAGVKRLPWGTHRGIVLFHVEHEETGRGKI